MTSTASNDTTVFSLSELLDAKCELDKLCAGWIPQRTLEAGPDVVLAIRSQFAHLDTRPSGYSHTEILGMKVVERKEPGWRII